MARSAAAFRAAVARRRHRRPQVIAITGGKLLTVSHGTIENGVLVMADGKIAAVGESGEVKMPAGREIVDAKGMTVYPGLIDPESNFGLTEISADQMSNDLVERSDEIMPHMHVYDAFHSETELIPVARLNGITNAVVAPATDDTISGQDIFIQLYGADRDRMIMGRDVALAMNYGAEQRRRGGRGGGGGCRNIPPRAWDSSPNCGRPSSTCRTTWPSTMPLCKKGRQGPSAT